MKIIFTLLWMCILSPGFVHAQPKVKKFEFEIGGGITCGAAKLGADKVSPGRFLILELRNNWHSKFDVGTQFTHSSYTREWNETDDISTTKTSTMQVVFDYNRRQGKIINPFVGGGIGMAIADDAAMLCLMPRIGIEFFRHLRFTIDYKWLPRFPDNYGYWGFSLGIVFGGGRKH